MVCPKIVWIWHWLTFSLNVVPNVYFDVSYLVTERSNHQRWSLFLKIPQYSQENVLKSLHISLIYQAWVGLINAEAATVRCSKKFSKFHKKTPVLEHGTIRSLFWIKLQLIKSATLLKLRLRHICFSVKFVKFLRTYF